MKQATKRISKTSWRPTSVEGYPKQWRTEHWRFSSGKDPRQAVSSASATSDERFLAISTESSICIFSVDGFKLVCVLKSNLDLIHKIEFAKVPAGGKDGYVLACHAQKGLSGQENEVQVWFLDEECKHRGNLDEETALKRGDWIAEGRFPPFASSVFSTDCTMLVYLSEVHDKWGFHSRATAAAIVTGKEKSHVQGHTDRIEWAGFSRDDKLFATTAWDGYLKLWDGTSGKLIRDYGPTGGQNWVCDFSTDSKNLAVSRAGPNTFVWRTDDPRSFPITLQGARGWQRAISWSPDGNRLAIGAQDIRLVVYDARSMTLEQLWQMGEVPQRITQEVTEIKWLENGKKILFKPNDGSAQMYDFERNKRWKWGPGGKEEMLPGAWFSLVVMEKRGLLGSVDRDGLFRIWKIPES